MVCKKLWLPENIRRSHISIKRGHAHVGTACTLAFNPLSEQTLPGNGILTLFVYILASPTMGAALGRGGEKPHFVEGVCRSTIKNRNNIRN